MVTNIVDGSGMVLAVLCHADGGHGERKNLATAGETLQAACKQLPSGWKSSLHRHLPQVRQTEGTQEAWVVIRGRVRFQVCDDNDVIIEEGYLGPGDCLVSFRGGHGLTVVEKGTTMYEFKNGPYTGQEEDKQWI